MQQYQITYKSSTISYFRFGSGKKLVFCLHGYGENGRTFSFLETPATGDFTFLAIDLPFHGNTEWNEGLNFTHYDLLTIIDRIKAEHKLLSDVKYLLMGYSLGGRIALSHYQLVPADIEKLILLAPDGLKLNFWYWFSTQTWLGNSLFFFTMKRPGWFLGFLKLINKLGWVNSSIFKFVNYYIADAGIRKLLYQRWTTFRKIKPRIPYIKSLVKKHQTPVWLLYGKHDRIILPANGEKFRLGIEEHCRISILHSGHQVLHEKHFAEILPALLQ